MTYWPKPQLFNFWASYKVLYSESFNFYFLGFWARKRSSYEYPTYKDIHEVTRVDVNHVLVCFFVPSSGNFTYSRAG